MSRDECPVRQGEHLAQLFRDHAEGLSGAVRGILGARSDTQEILQDAFLRAWSALRKGFAPRDPVAWVFVVTMNLAKDQRRMRQRRSPLQSMDGTGSTECGVTVPSQEPPPTAEVERAEVMAAAREAIHALQENEREVFLLRTSAGLTFEAVGEALDIPVGTAKTRMRSALARLRQRLRGFDPFPNAPDRTITSKPRS